MKDLQILSVFCWLGFTSGESTKIGHFWHVTDFHLDSNYSTGSVSKIKSRDYFLGDYAYDICWGKAEGKYGDFNCDASKELVQSAASFIKEKSQDLQDVQFIIWTGDDTAHTNDSFGSADESFQAIQFITDQLKATNLTVFPVLGNHDAYPHNQFYDHPEHELYQKTAEMWKLIGWPNEAYEDYKRNGGFYSVNYGPFLMVGLNTNLWYRSNKVDFMNPDDPMDQFKWLEDTLKNAQLSRAKVSCRRNIMFLHSRNLFFISGVFICSHSSRKIRTVLPIFRRRKSIRFSMVEKPIQRTIFEYFEGIFRYYSSSTLRPSSYRYF